MFYLVCFAYILNKRTELENSVHIELNNTIIEYCFKEQCGRRFTASMYNTTEQLNKILTSCGFLVYPCRGVDITVHFVVVSQCNICVYCSGRVLSLEDLGHGAVSVSSSGPQHDEW